MRTPWERATGKTEHGEQSALFAWANVAYWAGFASAWDRNFYTRPEPLKPFIESGPTVPALKWYHAVHNQGHGDAIRGAKAKAEGVKAGVPDTFLPVHMSYYHGLYIELKLPVYQNYRDGGLSSDQIECLAFLVSEGYATFVAYGWEPAARAIQNYLTYGDPNGQN